MPNLKEAFEQCAARGEKALIPFVTAGDPSLADLPSILTMLEEAGADAIEVGIPFSDPIADGPTIQASSQRALDRGVTPAAVLEKLSEASVRCPIVLMGYYNPVLRIGLDGFARQAKTAGAAGTIISDLTPEESEEWITAARAVGLDTIFLVAPTSTDARIQLACASSTGFVYAVSRTGVTGADVTMSSSVASLVQRVKACTSLPVCVGFGIGTPNHVREVCASADGAVVGSSLVDRLHNEWNDGRGANAIKAWVESLKAATRA